jgi:hypothetical protein
MTNPYKGNDPNGHRMLTSPSRTKAQADRIFIELDWEVLGANYPATPDTITPTHVRTKNRVGTLERIPKASMDQAIDEGTDHIFESFEVWDLKKPARRVRKGFW